MATNDTTEEAAASTAELETNGNGIPPHKGTIVLIHGLWMTPAC
jgi:hypothetical protein